MLNGNNGGTTKRDRTAARIIEALGESQGLLTLAARKAGVSYTTINRYVADYPSVRDAVQHAKESMLDFAEGKLYQGIRDGDKTMIIFFLKTQGKGRGYIEHVEQNGALNVTLNYKATDLTDEQLTVIARGGGRVVAPAVGPISTN